MSFTGIFARYLASPPALVDQQTVQLRVDSTGALAVTGGGGGGGGAVTIADGADVAEGATTATAYVDGTGAAAGTVVGLLKGLYVLIASLVVGVVLKAGSAIIGIVGIDQTTPGTTNGVYVNNTVQVESAAPAAPATGAIGSGAALSGAFDLVDQRLYALMADPTAWTAAAITFAVSIDNINFFPLYDQAGEVNISSAVVTFGVFIVIDPADMIGWRYLKVRSGTNAVPVNQGAARALTLVTVPR